MPLSPSACFCVLAILPFPPLAVGKGFAPRPTAPPPVVYYGNGKHPEMLNDSDTHAPVTWMLQLPSLPYLLCSKWIHMAWIDIFELVTPRETETKPPTWDETPYFKYWPQLQEQRRTG